ncbi:MAG TPA: Wzy polymerase domain-containing protein, partial [Verrucomicrobiae bacterium]|nr:Wzy polymerase domain-containing protein [Verrucomicrobiae bacterium]
RNMAQQVLSDPEAAGSEAALKSYSHDTDATGNLLAAHGFSAEAEAAYRLASQLWPGSPESVGNLADLLARNGLETEARQILEQFDRQYPDQRKDLERVSAVWRATGPAQSGGP